MGCFVREGVQTPISPTHCTSLYYQYTPRFILWFPKSAGLRSINYRGGRKNKIITRLAPHGGLLVGTDNQQRQANLANLPAWPTHSVSGSRAGGKLIATIKRTTRILRLQLALCHKHGPKSRRNTSYCTDSVCCIFEIGGVKQRHRLFKQRTCDHSSRVRGI